MRRGVEKTYLYIILGGYAKTQEGKPKRNDIIDQKLDLWLRGRAFRSHRKGQWFESIQVHIRVKIL